MTTKKPKTLNKEIFELEFNSNTIEFLAKKYDVCKNTIENWAKSFGIERKRIRPPTETEFIGQFFGFWEVIKKNIRNKYGCRLWTVRCKCGKEKIVATGHLRALESKSCGCSRRIGDVRLGYWNSVLAKAKSRDIPVNITWEDAWNQFVKQHGKCALTGEDLILSWGRNGQTASLDRIDSQKSYEVNNLQWIHKDLNWMKNRFTQEYFIFKCKQVAKQAELDAQNSQDYQI